MNSGRKRRHADALEGDSSPRPRRRRRRIPTPTSFQAVGSFALRSLASSLRKKRKRRHDDAASTARLRRRCSRRCLSPVQFPALRTPSPGAALAAAAAATTTPRRDRNLHVDDDARCAVTTPRRRRRSLSSHFPVLGPFALRFFLRTGASTPHRRRKPAHTKRPDGSPEVADLTVEPELENIDAVGRTIGDRISVPALGSSRSPEKKEWPKKRSRRLLDSGFERLKVAELPGLLDNTASKEDLSELFTPLSGKDQREVNTLLCNSDDSDKILVTHEPSNIMITKEKLQCLRPCGWLNDEVINLYIELLKEREKREPNRFLKCHFFNTFFYKKLTCGIAGYDYQSVRRWTTFKRLGYGLVECEKIFVPVHINVHWCLVVINMKDKTLQYLDSLGGWGHDVLKVLTRYIMDELMDKSNKEVDPSSWMVVSGSVPLQQNGWDCGMFMLKYIDFHSRGIEPSFSQEHMVYFRKRTAKEIMTLRAD